MFHPTRTALARRSSQARATRSSAWRTTPRTARQASTPRPRPTHPVHRSSYSQPPRPPPPARLRGMAQPSTQASNAELGRQEQGKPASSLTGAAAASSAAATVTLPGASGAKTSGGQPKEDQPFSRIRRGRDGLRPATAAASSDSDNSELQGVRKRLLNTDGDNSALLTGQETRG